MKQATRGVAKTPQPAPGPRAFEDIPWRVGYRVRRFLFLIWGPPQLDDAHDPVKGLARERAERYAARVRKSDPRS